VYAGPWAWIRRGSGILACCLRHWKLFPLLTGRRRSVLELNRAFPHLSKTGAPLYLNLMLGKVKGGLHRGYQKKLLEGVECLNRLLPMQVPQGLQQFADTYRKKFEGRALPLLVALDPELGVGYEALASGYSRPRLLRDLDFRQADTGHPVLEWTPAHALLQEKWNARPHPGAAIQLVEQDLERLPPENRPGVLPPTTSVLFRVKDDRVFIEQAGGASAAALAGRFTPLDEEINSLARAIAAQEQQASPGVVFAEIAHVSDMHTANIDRREVSRDFEIPVLVQSTLPAERQLALSDLWVKVEAGQVILFSEKLQKVIVPRLSSAFNYLRNDLAVFRFLCDLQYQGLKANLTLDLSSFFPGMRFYPRVAFKSAVLHLATWHLKKEDYASVTGTAGEQGLQQVRELASRQGWPRCIALTEHDHQLVIDLQQAEDLVLLRQALQKKEQVVIREFPFLDVSAPVVADTEKRPYIHQFLAALYREQEVYPAGRLHVAGRHQVKKEKRRLLPGHEWLYFKIYCHPSRANGILTDLVLPVITRLQKQGAVRQWFYVRYRDPEYHLRVRLSLTTEHAGNAMNRVHAKLAGPLRKGVVRDVQVAVYERELERYGPACMEAAEAFFCASSALIAGSVKRISPDETDFTYYRVGFEGVEAIAAAFTAGLAEKVALLSGLYESFYLEFGGDKALREQLSALYRDLSRAGILPDPTPENPKKQRQPLKGYWQRLEGTLRDIGQKAALLPPERKAQLAADLIHMHLNRLFVDDARKQELVTYYCLWRHYKSLLARSRA
jgi:lantibiotic biosynthesis protein